MKTQWFRVTVLAGLVAAVGSAVPALAQPAAKAPPKPSWRVTGELEEACSCHAACPCWFKSVPSRMTCDGAQAIFISKGSYGKVSLDGLAVAQFVQSPEGKSMFESFGNWNFDYVYIDERANEDQRAALRDIASHFFPPAAKSRKFQYVPIRRDILGSETTVTVGSKGSFSGHLIEGGYKGTPKVTNPPLADPTHREFLQGQTTRMTFRDAGQKWNYTNSNYMRNKFKVDDREYAKYAAAVAQKMAAMSTPSKNGN